MKSPGYFINYSTLLFTNHSHIITFFMAFFIFTHMHIFKMYIYSGVYSLNIFNMHTHALIYMKLPFLNAILLTAAP